MVERIVNIINFPDSLDDENEISLLSLLEQLFAVVVVSKRMSETYSLQFSRQTQLSSL